MLVSVIQKKTGAGWGGENCWNDVLVKERDGIQYLDGRVVLRLRRGSLSSRVTDGKAECMTALARRWLMWWEHGEVVFYVFVLSVCVVVLVFGLLKFSQ